MKNKSQSTWRLYIEEQNRQRAQKDEGLVFLKERQWGLVLNKITTIHKQSLKYDSVDPLSKRKTCFVLQNISKIKVSKWVILSSANFSRVIFYEWNQWANFLNRISFLNHMTNSKRYILTSIRPTTTKISRIETLDEGLPLARNHGQNILRLYLDVLLIFLFHASESKGD